MNFDRHILPEQINMSSETIWYPRLVLAYLEADIGYCSGWLVALVASQHTHTHAHTRLRTPTNWEQTYVFLLDLGNKATWMGLKPNISKIIEKGKEKRTKKTKRFHMLLMLLQVIKVILEWMNHPWNCFWNRGQSQKSKKELFNVPYDISYFSLLYNMPHFYSSLLN